MTKTLGDYVEERNLNAKLSNFHNLIIRIDGNVVISEMEYKKKKLNVLEVQSFGEDGVSKGWIKIGVPDYVLNQIAELYVRGAKMVKFKLEKRNGKSFYNVYDVTKQGGTD